MRIVLKQRSDPKWSMEATGDPDRFEPGASVRLDGIDKSFSISRRVTAIAPDGTTYVEATLDDGRRWFSGLEDFAARHDWVIPAGGVLLILLLALILASGFWFLSLSAAMRSAWIGYAVANGQWPLWVGTCLVMLIIVERFIPARPSFLRPMFTMITVPLAYVVAYIWGALFLFGRDLSWPDGYAALADEFGTNWRSFAALALTYLPLAIAILKWNWLTLLTSFLKGEKPK